jgi:hypothetical protein
MFFVKGGGRPPLEKQQNKYTFSRRFGTSLTTLSRVEQKNDGHHLH